MSALMNALVRARAAQLRGAAAGRELAGQDAAAALEAERQAARERRDVARFDLDTRQAEWAMGAEARRRAERDAERTAFRRYVAPRVLGSEAAEFLEGLPDDVDVSPLISTALERQRDAREFKQTMQLQDRADARAERAAARADARAEKAAQRAAERAAATAGRGDFKDTMTLRGAYEGNQSVKDATDVAAALRNARASAGLRHGQGDNSLVYAVAKILDPGSVVREGEFATIARSAALSEQVKAAVARVQRGERLSPEMRRQLVQVAESRAQAAREGIRPVMARYGGLARMGGVDSALVAFDPFDDEGASPPPAAAAPTGSGSAIMDALLTPRRSESLPRSSGAPATGLPFDQWDAQRAPARRGSRP